MMTGPAVTSHGRRGNRWRLIPVRFSPILGISAVHHSFRSSLLLLAFFLAFLPVGLSAKVTVSPLFSDHMVLQRDMAVPIYGQATPMAKVTVQFRDQTKSTTADAAGKWLLKLDALKAGGPDKLTISDGEPLILDDVLVGEVWVGSGQSNMQGSVSGYAKGDPVLAELAKKDYPTIRLSGSGGNWRVSNEKNNAGFSALLFSFGVRLQENLDVPIGLMQGAVGGTPSGFWLTQPMLDAHAPAKQNIARFAATYNYEEQMKKHEAALVQWEKAAAEAKEKKAKIPAKPAAPIKPGESRGQIGNLFEKHIRAMVGYGIRGVVWDQGESGTAIQGLDQYHAMGALITGWRQAWGQGDFAFIHIQKPSGDGPAWDKTNPVTNKASDFAPLPAQVPGLRDGDYRDMHIRISNHPNTAMATASDLGAGIHPTNKSGYGTRASQVALGLVYGKKIAYYGPTYKAHTIEGNKVRITFNHVGQGLAYKHGDKLQGFALAGEDKVFHWADATIDGDTVVLTSAKVTKPVAVRYAYASKHPWANFFNKDGLPALPFRTDAW